MPLFVLLSGYLSRKKGYKDFWYSEGSLLATLIVFELINFLLKYIIQGTIISLICPYRILWYLFSLICWRAFIQFMPDVILKKRNLMISLSFIIMFCSCFIKNGYTLSISRTLSFFPFFLIGFYMDQTYLTSLRKKKRLGIVLLLIYMIMSILITTFLGSDVKIFYRGAQGFNSLHLNTVSFVLIKGYVTISAYIASMATLMIFSSENQCMGNEGKNSLMYYLYHYIIIEFVFTPFISYLGVTPNIALALFCTTVNIVIIKIATTNIFFYHMANPLPFIIDKLK